MEELASYINLSLFLEIIINMISTIDRLQENFFLYNRALLIASEKGFNKPHDIIEFEFINPKGEVSRAKESRQKVNDYLIGGKRKQKKIVMKELVKAEKDLAISAKSLKNYMITIKKNN